MKKLYLVALLVVVMLLSLTGCGKTDYQRYTEAYDNMANITTAAAKGEAKINVQIGDSMSMSIPIAFEVKYDYSNENAPKMLLVFSMSMFGTATSTSIYTDAEYTYTASTSKIGELEETTKIKEKIEVDSADVNADIFKDIEIFTESDFEGIEKEDVDGGIKYTITKSGDWVKSLLENIINTVISKSDASEEQMLEGKDEIEAMLKDITLGDLTLKFVIKDGYMTNYEIAMENVGYTMEDDSDLGMLFTGSISMSFEASLDFESINEKITIEPPYALDEYEEESDDDDFDFDF